ncbi:hypothetical protein [Saccharopolyspora elongata]|uniref:Uncharacterized protein n=1 Tax=Saccharopolyspora elongata TaxID=2530387 RepID=A0A4R4XQH9_9PSEU|nr:hypothetical protein [Saccharopolyspora elongata]TDD33370.1 hypothetical protein E1288_45570 [Saccharopolyspora elongata]
MPTTAEPLRHDCPELVVEAAGAELTPAQIRALAEHARDLAERPVARAERDFASPVVNLHAADPAPVAAVAQVLTDGITEHASRMRGVPTTAAGYRLPGGDSLHMRVLHDPSPVAQAVIAVGPAGGKTDMLGWAEDADEFKLAHEGGHFYGLYDEYVRRDEHGDDWVFCITCRTYERLWDKWLA